MWESSEGLKGYADEISRINKSINRESRFVVAPLIWG